MFYTRILKINYYFFGSVKTPVIMLNSAAEATTISLSWTSAGSVVDSYEVMWEKDTSGECPNEDEGSVTRDGDTTSYDIMGLAGISSYAITVTASNAVGSAVSESVSGMTGEIGESSHVAVLHKSLLL